MDIYPTTILSEDYYVYAYLRIKDSANGKAGTPYYIGKGKGDRAWHGRHRVPVPKEKWRIVIVACNLSELWSLIMERKLIRLWGRLDNGTGVLHNLTDGGESNYGLIHNTVTRQKMSLAAKGKKKSPEHVEKIASQKRGCKVNMTPEELAERGKNISAAKKGVPNPYKGSKRTGQALENIRKGHEGHIYKHTEESKLLISQTHKGKPWSEARRQAYLNKKKMEK